MSDEQRKEEETEVEAHRLRRSANDEPSEEAEGEDDFEAHRLRKDTMRKD
jgi:hypothetical protein